MTLPISRKSSRANASQLRHYAELLRVLVERNLGKRYRGSFVGIYWSLLNPLIMAGIYTGFLGRHFASYFDDSIFNYVLAAFTGLVIIQFFSAATSQALSSIVSNGGLLNKIHLPVGIFPLAAILANIFQFTAATFPLLAIVTIWQSGSVLKVLALIVPIVALALVSSGVGYILSAMFVFFRDIPYFYSLVIYALRIMTPIFYPVEIVPDRMRNVIAYNPLSQIIITIRQIALTTDPIDFSLILNTLLIGIVVAIVGWFCFERLRPHFMDLL